jgi:hypothetical protein
MSYQDPTGGDTLTTEGANVPPLVGYGADSTLHTNAGDDAIPTSVTTPPGATPATGAPRPTASPQQLGATQRGADEPEDVTIEVTEVEVEALDDESWNLRRTGLIAGVVAAGLAAGAGIAWFLISRRRAQQARLAAAQVAQTRRFFSMAPTPATALAPMRRRLADAADSGAALTALARQSARDASAMATALAETAMATAQDARERALAASQLARELLDQTVSASQVAQGRLTDTWGRTRDTAATSWEAAGETAKVARDATMRTAKSARDAAQQTAKVARIQSQRTAKIARAESERTAKVARVGFTKAQRTATR